MNVRVDFIFATQNRVAIQILRTAESMESTFVVKDSDYESLHIRLQESNTKLHKLLQKNEQFEEKNKQIRELETQLATLNKVCALLNSSFEIFLFL